MLPEQDAARQRLELAMLDSRENLLDFFSRTGFEAHDVSWLEVRIEAPQPAAGHDRLEGIGRPAVAAQALRLA